MNITTVSTIFTLIIAVMAYFGNFTGVDKATLKNEYVKKGEATFDDLQASIKNRYYEEKKRLLGHSSNLASFEASKRVETQEVSNENRHSDKIKSVENSPQDIETETVDVPQSTATVQIEKHPAKKEEFTSQVACTQMGVNEYTIDAECRKKLYDFFTTIDPNDYTFEIIPVVDKHDFIILKQIKQNPQLCKGMEPQISDNQMKKLFTLANAGLGVKRSQEARWLLRQRFGKDIQVKFTPYTIETNYERGFLIRLYK